MNSVKVLATCAILIFGSFLVMSILMSFKSPNPVPTPSNIYRVTSYDGITVYSYGDYIIVKTDNSVSISR